MAVYRHCAARLLACFGLGPVYSERMAAIGLDRSWGAAFQIGSSFRLTHYARQLVCLQPQRASGDGRIVPLTHLVAAAMHRARKVDASSIEMRKISNIGTGLL